MISPLQALVPQKAAKEIQSTDTSSFGLITSII
jgi:hypothetical protein